MWSETSRTGIREGLGVEDPVGVGDRVGGGGLNEIGI